MHRLSGRLVDRRANDWFAIDSSAQANCNERGPSPEMCVMLYSTAPSAAEESAQSDFPHSLLEFRTPRGRLSTQSGTPVCQRKTDNPVAKTVYVSQAARTGQKRPSRIHSNCRQGSFRRSIGGDDRGRAETAKSPIQSGADDIRSDGSDLRRTNHRRGKAYLRPTYAAELHKEIFGLQRDIIRHSIFGAGSGRPTSVSRRSRAKNCPERAGYELRGAGGYL